MTGEAKASAPTGPALTQRLDKWLWCARLAKTRTQAAALVTGGKIRVNRVKTDKPSHAVRAGYVITASLGPRVKVLKIVAIAERRGSADLARELFEDLTPPVDQATDGRGPRGADQFAGRTAAREPGSGRPTKRERRQLDRLKDDE